MTEFSKISRTEIKSKKKITNCIWEAIYNDEKVLIIDKDKYIYEFESKNFIKIIGEYRDENINKLVLEYYEPLEMYLKNKELSVFEIKKLLISLKNNFKELHRNNLFQNITLSTIYIKKENNELVFKMLYPEKENNNDDSHYIKNEKKLFYSLEILNGKLDFDEKDNIWSLGIILFYITQKKYPFEIQDEDEEFNINNKIKQNELKFEDITQKKYPFEIQDEDEEFNINNKIKQNELKFEETILYNDLKNLIEKMLNKEKEKRIDFTKLYEDDFFTKKKLYDYFYRLLSYNIMNSKLTIINLFRLIFVSSENKKILLDILINIVSSENKKILLDILINIGFFIFRISFHILSSIIFNNDDSKSFYYHKRKYLDKLTVPNSIICLVIFTFINFLLKMSKNWKYRILLYPIFIIIQFCSLILSISFFNVFKKAHKIIVLKVIFNYFLCNCYIFLLFFINAYLKMEYIIENKKKYEKFVKFLDYII